MGLTRLRAEQISDIDYKQAVRVITVTNVTLSGGAPSQVDGVTLSVGDRVLVNGQNTGSQNGIYEVQTVGTGGNGTWIRSTDTNATGELEAGTIVMVTEGTVYKDTQWKLTTNNPIIIGTTALTFEQNSAFAFGNVFANGTAVLANTVGDVLTLTAGNNIQITGNNTAKSVTIAVTGISLNSISNGTSNVNVVSSGGNVTVGVGGTANVAEFSTGGLRVTGFASASGNVTGGNLTTAGLVTATGNVTGGNLTTAGTVTATGNVDAGNIRTAGTVTATGNVDAGNIRTAGLVTATANVTGGNLLTGGLISATSTITSAANVIGGNISTAGLITATGNITGGNILTSGLVSSTSNITGGNVLTGGTVSATANITGGNIVTAGAITATGNITGGNINLSGNIVDIGALTISTGSGDLNLAPAGNVNLGNRYINNINNPVQNQDAATKIYVDNAVSTSISYHEPVVAATTADLATTTGGTITYAQPNGAGNGIGATITTTGSFNLIDTANVQTANTRILVKNEANAVLNGVYVWSNATVITRATDADEYGAGNVNALGLNDYFFVSSGNVNKGSAYVVSAPTGTITFGTSNITFAQFSSSQTYTANTSAGISLAGTVINAKVDGVTTAFDGGGNISVKASATLTTPNIGAATGTSVSVTGNIDGGNLRTAGQVTAAGNVTGGNILTGGLISATSTITSAANITGGNVLTAGLISSAGNVTSGNIRTAGAITATGNIFGNTIFANGTQLTGINAFGNIVVAGETTVSADSTSDTLTLAEGSGISILTDAANNTITIGTVATDSVFATGGDMGTVTEAVTTSEDLGLVTDAVTISYDLGGVATTGPIFPSQLVLPTYTSGTLPSASPAGQFIYLSTSSIGAMTAFSDGSNWRFTSSGNVVS